MAAEQRKPLGRKAYGTIGHLPGSRMGPKDKHVPEGQARIATEKVRDRHDFVWVTEKLDGACVSIAKLLDGSMLALTKSGLSAVDSPFRQLRLFNDWAMVNRHRFDALLRAGERVVGEWLAQAHGTRYALDHEPFVAFDIMVEDVRYPFEDVMHRCAEQMIVTPYVISDDGLPLAIERATKYLHETGGGHFATDAVEGAVWRVERHGEFDFMAKYVRPDKVDGKFLPEITGGDPVWNVPPEKVLDPNGVL